MVVARAIPTPALIMLRNAYYQNAITLQSIKLRFQLMSAQLIAKMHAEGEIWAWNYADGHLLQPPASTGQIGPISFDLTQ